MYVMLTGQQKSIVLTVIILILPVGSNTSDLTNKIYRKYHCNIVLNPELQHFAFCFASLVIYEMAVL